MATPSPTAGYADPAAQPWYQQLWQSARNNYITDPGAWLSLLPTALGTIGQLFNAQTANQRYQQALRASQGAGDWRQFYQPMSDMAQAAMRRSIAADLVTRGIPMDSAFASALTSERFGGMEAELVHRAQQLAQNQRGNYVNTIMGAPQGGLGAGLAAAGGAFSSIGNYLAYKRMLEAREKAAREAGAVNTQGLGKNVGDPTFGLDPGAYLGMDPWGQGGGGGMPNASTFYSGSTTPLHATAPNPGAPRPDYWNAFSRPAPDAFEIDYP